MAASTSTKSKGRGSQPIRLRRPGAPAKGGGARPVATKVGGRQKPNPILLGGLALVAVAGFARVAMPSLFGGKGTSAVASFPAPLTDRHLVRRVTTSTALNGGAATTTPPRPIRDPFTPPPGFANQ